MIEDDAVETVSIIIPAYNHARYIRQAVLSALNQSYADVEALVIDDGSTDNTKDVVDPLGTDPRLTYIRQENQGLPSARNRGILAGHGKYVNFLDADDYLHPDKIAHQVNFLEDNPEYDLIYCDIWRVGDDGEPLDDYSIGGTRQQLTGDLFVPLMLGGYFPPHTVLLRRSALDRVGYFDLDLNGCADYDLWLRLAGHGCRAYYLDEKLAYYRIHPDSMSQDTAHMEQTYLRAIRKATERFPEKVALGVKEITDLNAILFDANRWLNEQYSKLDQERHNWQKTAEEYAQGKEWLETQWHNWQKLAEERSRIINYNLIAGRMKSFFLAAKEFVLRR